MDLDTAVEEKQMNVRLGRSVRTRRLAAELTLKDLAKRASCSESMLSKVENGRVAPSISTLHRIAAAMGTNVAELMTEQSRPVTVVMRAKTRELMRFGGDLDPMRGVLVERLTPVFAGMMLQADLYVVPPGCGSGGLLQHEGEEMGLVLQGSIELSVGNETHVVREGDSFLFRSEEPHSFVNKSNDIARVVWVNTPPTF